MVFITSAFVGLLHGYDRFDLVNAVICSTLLSVVATPLLLPLGGIPLVTGVADAASAVLDSSRFRRRVLALAGLIVGP